MFCTDAPSALLPAGDMKTWLFKSHHNFKPQKTFVTTTILAFPRLLKLF